MSEFSVNDYIRTGQVSFKEPAADAFGRIRVSEPHTIFEGKFLYDSGSVRWDYLTAGVGAGIGVIGTKSTLDLYVSASGSRTVTQTRRYMAYQPGKSQMSLITGILMPSGSIVDVRSRIGVFDDNRDKTFATTAPGGNGYFWEHNGTNFNVVRRSYVTGQQVDTIVSQSAWNYDRMDGTGSSSILIDPSKLQIFYMDQEWLGAGTVRMGFVVDGNIYVAHKFHHSNLQKDMHTQTATLPVRYEIERVAGSGSAQLVQGCCSIASEGGFNPRGKIGSYTMSGTVTAADGVWTPISSFRVRPQHSRTCIMPLAIDLLTTSNRSFIWKLVQGIPNSQYKIALTNASWTDIVGMSAQYDTSATAYTGTPREIIGGYCYTTTRTVDVSMLDQELYLRSSLTGEPEILTLLVQGIGGTAAVYSSFAWRETF
jgi:hypothetical protein